MDGVVVLLRRSEERSPNPSKACFTFTSLLHTLTAKGHTRLGTIISEAADKVIENALVRLRVDYTAGST